MFVLIVGCGRVGSSIAHSMLLEGHEVSVLDEDAEAIALLDRDADASWEERFAARAPQIAIVEGASGEVRDLAWERIEPGRYRARAAPKTRASSCTGRWEASQERRSTSLYGLGTPPAEPDSSPELEVPRPPRQIAPDRRGWA